MAWSNDVVRLQDIDMERIKINARCTAIQQALADDEGLADAKSALDKAQHALEEVRKRQETLEFELSRVQSKSRLTQHKLYSGQVTNSRELQDLQAEGESLKRRDEELEDEVLDVMLEREEAEHIVATAQQTLVQREALTSNHHTVLSQERTQLQAKDNELSNERAVLVAKLPPTIFETYTYLLPRTGNRPVAILHQEQCGVCGMDVSPSNAQKANHGEEAYCGGCRRLLVRID